MAKVELLLSGGLAKGAYQIGALRALEKYFAPEDLVCVSASSVGALNAQSYVTGHTEEMRAFWEGANADSPKRKSIVRFLHGSYVPDAVHRIAALGQSKVPFYVPLMQARERTIYYADLSKIPPEQMDTYISAAVAVPAVYPAVTIDGVKYADGGWVDNMPIYPLPLCEPDYVIALYFDKYEYFFANKDLNQRIIRIHFPNNSILADSLFIDHASVMKMMASGEEYAEEVLEKVIGTERDDVERVLARIAEDREAHKKERKRLTADRMLNGIGRLTKGLWKRAILTPGAQAATDAADGDGDHDGGSDEGDRAGDRSGDRAAGSDNDTAGSGRYGNDPSAAGSGRYGNDPSADGCDSGGGEAPTARDTADAGTGAPSADERHSEASDDTEGQT